MATRSRRCSDEEEDFKFLDDFVKERQGSQEKSSPREVEDYKIEKIRENKVNRLKKQIVLNSPRCIRKFCSVSSPAKEKKDPEASQQWTGSLTNLNSSYKMARQDSNAMSSSSDMSSASSGSQVPQILKENIYKLEVLAQQFQMMNTNLSQIVAEEQDLLQDLDDEDTENLHRIRYLNLSAQTDIQWACLAYHDYKCTIQEFGRVMNIEEALILDKAIELGIGSQCMFTKVKSQAVARLHRTDEDE